MVKTFKKKTIKKKFSPLFFPITTGLLCFIIGFSYYHFFIKEVSFEKINMEVTVSSAFRGEEIYRYPGFFIDYCKAKTGEIIVVEITIKNTTDKPITVDHFPIIDSQDRIFESNNNLTSCIKSTHIMWFPRKINPGMITSFVSIYEVPIGNKIEYSIKVYDGKLIKLDFE